MYKSFPSAATFFCTYELTKTVLGNRLPEKYAPLVHMLAASLGEVVRNLIKSFVFYKIFVYETLGVH